MTNFSTTAASSDAKNPDAAHIPPSGWGQRIGDLRRSKFVKDAIGLTTGKGLNLVLGMLSTLIFGIVFAKPEIAMISLFEMLVDLVMAFGVNWSAAGITRFGKDELHKKQSLAYTSSTRLYVLVPIVVTAVILLLFFRTSVLDYLGAANPVLIWYLIGSLIVSLLHDQLTTMLATREKHFANALFYVAQGVAKLVILATFLSGIIEPSAIGYVSALMWLNGLILLLRLPSCGSSFLYPMQRVRSEDLQAFVRYVVPQLYGVAGIYVVNWVDVYFIRKYGTLDALGAYQFLYSIFLKFAVFAFVANSILFPRIMAWKIENPDAIARFARKVPHLVLIVTILCSGLLLVLFPPLFDAFFGDKYVMGYVSFSLLICSLPCYFISYLFIPVLNSYDRVRYVQNINILSAICNLVVDYLLVPRFGIIGAALGTFVAYWVKAVLLMMPVHELFALRWRLILFLHIVLAGYVVFRFVAAVTL
ncbi:hypothetical protein CA13_35790 [Planctomycetes bacterium CA13]|uniref:Uncharacterized protein n=1 Tax=Novipirellula herctigrandis TaxID=2527986 RepID=A0A5C5Z452_9BACT|nr:hypothetical protein CA13_35790 [Planctomycetes bacterium CA13]